MTEPRELGSLTATDLGATVTITEGGSQHTGMLASTQHQLNLLDEAQTLIVLKATDWLHVRTYPSATLIDLTPADQEHTP